MNEFGIVISVWNLFVFFLYGADKLRAKRRTRRIREVTLIAPAFLLGGAGAMFGMVLFNHKTSKMKFRILVPVAFIINIVVVMFIKAMI